jgi:hypothetical protein
MQEHPAILVPYSIEIDTLMVPLIRECWRREWHTRYCCQGNPFSEWAYIAFRGPHASAFQQAVSLVYSRWTHLLEANGEVIRFPQSGIRKATRALKKL